MIQPLKSEPSVWSLCWVDLKEPLPVEGDFYLPTILLLAGPQFEPLAPPGIFAELDQIQAEEWLARIFDDIGTPDELLVWRADEWVPGDWKYFARDWKTKVKIVTPPPHEARMQSELATAGRSSGKSAPSVSRAEISEGLVRNVRRVRSQRKRRSSLEKAVELDQANTAARMELSEMEFHAGRYTRSLELAREVEQIDAPRFRRGHADWWTDHATRPLLRSLFGQMLCQWHLGRSPDAADSGRRLLEIDATDHLGARFYTPLFLLLAGEQDDAIAFFRSYAQRYPGDMPNAWLSFAWALALCLEGDDQGARQKYREGMMANIYIAPRLLGERQPPEDIYHPSEREEPLPAADFAGSFGMLWEREAGAMRVLRDAYAELRPVLEELVARRAKMADFMDHRYDPDYRAKWSKLLDEDEKFVAAVIAGSSV
ncbi:MAG: hypothetical protein FGM15_02345 [Chthoniobacterales bacterium]|nr:hypothetical protein [Chthoniobacterales bacterium]